MRARHCDGRRANSSLARVGEGRLAGAAVCHSGKDIDFLRSDKKLLTLNSILCPNSKERVFTPFF